ncbi:MAG: hypothetical protein DWI57_13145 [Chloroflexi bacterium]|nr:MAG: hypothetical protein DWI57_13145 [Chloroflexota bacterium]
MTGFDTRAAPAFQHNVVAAVAADMQDGSIQRIFFTPSFAIDHFDSIARLSGIHSTNLYPKTNDEYWATVYKQQRTL